MQTITVQQPYATLLALGYKKYETRSWLTTYRGPLLIHAGSQYGADNIAVAYSPNVSRFLKSAGYRSFKDLPRGAIIAYTTLTNCIHCADLYEQETAHPLYTTQEAEIGCFDYHYYAWELHNARPCQPHIPTTGKQGLWEFDIERAIMASRKMPPHTAHTSTENQQACLNRLLSP